MSCKVYDLVLYILKIHDLHLFYIIYIVLPVKQNTLRLFSGQRSHNSQ